MRSPYFFALIASFTVLPVTEAQISNPIPETIETGDLILELEPYITMPQSSGGGGGRARISALRPLPDGRLFVNDNRGQLYRIDTGSASVYLNLRSQISAFIDQPGLGTGFQSFTFHPDFLNNGKFYTTHTESWNSNPNPDFKGPTAPINSGGHQGVITEWTATDPSANTFSGTRRELFRVYFPGTIHGLQEIKFNPNATESDPDYGMLYICIGEGGGYLKGYWQNEHRLDSPMGTIFRIDPAGNNSSNGNYGIPADNPFVNDTTPGGIKEIYAYGFRNPHRISWDTEGARHLYTGDIGETQVEEINQVDPGGDYGFPEREGTFLLVPDEPQNNNKVYPLPSNDATFGYTYPVVQYDHGEAIAMMLGGVYRGSIPALKGLMIFGGVAGGRVFYVPGSDLVQGSQASEILEARLELEGVEGSLTSFVGSGRADLRFGFDGDGELYLLTKTDGKIRKVVGARLSDEARFDNNPEDWELVNDFENGLSGMADFSNGVSIVPDPFGDAANHVLSMAGSAGTAATILPALSEEEESSLYFRFAFTGSSVNGSLAPAKSTGDSISSNNVPIVIEASGSGWLSGTDSSGSENLFDELRSGIWYEMWLLLDPVTEAYSAYLKGDQLTSPTLVSAGLSPRSTLSGVSAFLWAYANGSQSQFYFDDLYCDTTDANASSPLTGSWLLVSNFESETALDTWTFVDSASGFSTPPATSVEWAEEMSGNRFLSIQCTNTSGAHTIGYTPLPTSIEVSHIYTLYGRVQVESTQVNQALGLSNLDGTEIESMRYTAFEVIGRFTNDNGAQPEILVYDDNGYDGISDPIGGADLDPLGVGTWYEYWFVVRNGGEASGGQTFDVYLRPESRNQTPELVYSDAGFRTARERPIRNLGFIANKGDQGFTGRVGYDDMYLHFGEQLNRPSGTGIGPFPGARGWKESPWFGWLFDSDYPWIYHVTHNWVYISSDGSGGVWYYDPILGWTWTRPDIYPYVYLSADSEWAWYQVDSSKPRWFYGTVRKNWFSTQ